MRGEEYNRLALDLFNARNPLGLRKLREDRRAGGHQVTGKEKRMFHSNLVRKLRPYPGRLLFHHLQPSNERSARTLSRAKPFFA
jgi:hypothetical protein